ncbi:4-hydroxy-tetrahydrodipicolinate synthase [Solibacillus kalamii]|uniref:4-hydroxy-tetrahydrodipicolinate synthase n=2 Tax=Solibacillus TaxID=648800 RepID=K1L466_9BACL|nr:MULTISPECIES: 4-hydroxy-tetrahydrodipicolinate synthase [Solibacillus]AMO84749.1 4-hydroxy-tetrahydrodipicolinate synthase [Solibacillus silvestris]EKB46812.1 Dihydrodipicolinate synthase [Solibacillus isronensis B3W22]MBM7665224.1 4-hydroxy-tetrahydrodipicolinate synthase [Solibacillus kalamii]OBW58465.1 4-hydroxy-tetrahydrodipicolinate synthase [Solibacillus silvestris]OUZ40416.1 4-hydroxy-tetrahydrodipicolinate synthase [Solibacillus kalamii]
MDFGRIGTAMITPFKKDGTINYPELERIINHLIENGTDSIIACGTTSENPTMSTEEKIEVVRFTVEKVAGRIPVIAGTGDNETAYSIMMTHKAEENGANGIMLVTPYYNKPNQRGMYAHFKTIAKETKLPVMLYNVPGRTGANILAETTIAISKDVPNITCIKEASGNLDQMGDIIENVDSDFHVYSGDDGLTLPLLAIGGRGIISVASHVVGKDMQQMVRAFEEGRHQEAAKIHRALLPLVRALFAQPNPSPIKYAMTKLGFDTLDVRMPMMEMLPEEKAAFDEIWDTYQEKAKGFRALQVN